MKDTNGITELLNDLQSNRPQVLDNVSDHSTDIVDVLTLDHALIKLATEDSAQARIVELRYFGGLTISETVSALELSPANVKRKWSLAQAWLYHEMHVTES